MKVVANGHTAYYELHGEAGAPVVAFSHALAHNSTMWRAQIGALEKDYRVLCYDIRGHGRSAATDGPYDLDALADDAEALLDGLGLEQVQWVGSCLGGMVGQRLAQRPSRHIAGLVLTSTMASLADEARSGWLERGRIATGQGLEALVAPILDEWFTPSYRQQAPPALLESKAGILATSRAGYAGCCQAILGLDDLVPLEALDLPTLVVAGAEDKVSTVAAALAIHERIAGSRLEIVQWAAHLAVVEQAQRFNEMLLEFLR